MAEWKNPENCIPVLFVSGTHYEAARLTGSTFSARITEYCKNEAEYLDKAIALCGTETGKAHYDGFYEVGQRRCPQYMDEIKGLADGAGLPFQTIFLMNHIQEFDNLLPETNEEKPDQDEGHRGCTDILVSSGNNHSAITQFTEANLAKLAKYLANTAQYWVLLGHTEDGVGSAKDTDFVMVADIAEYTAEDGRVFEAEKFIAQCIAGNLPGWCLGVNQHGLAYVENALHSGVQATNKLGEMLHQRHLLTAKNVDDVLRILEDKDNGSHNAICFNFGFQGNNTLYSVEVCPKPLDVPGNTTHVRELANTDGSDNTGYYVHTNHYIEQDIPGQDISDSSLNRLKTAGSTKTLRTMADVCEMLGLVNRQNEQHPPITVCTLCTVIMDLVAGELLMYRKRGTPSEPPLLRLPFSILK